MPPSTLVPSCSRCLAYEPTKKQCRLKAPTVLVITTSEALSGNIKQIVVGAFPPIEPHEWCGEFKDRES